MTEPRKVRTSGPQSEARQAVLRQLAAAYDELAEYEQELVGAGFYDDAEVPHDLASWVLRAFNAEQKSGNR